MKPFIENNNVVVLGVIQEQHADRCLLFQQWQGLEFPIAQDQFNANGIKEVPVYVAIDEFGIVRGHPRKPTGFADEFIHAEFEQPEEPAKTADLNAISPEHWRMRLKQVQSTENLVGLADSLLNWNRDATSVEQAIELYRKATDQQPGRGDLRFRLGVANRIMYELKDRTDSLYFSNAVSNWEAALNRRPNQYIYRRRIEQYGPRLKKPYSFYDWVNSARREIAARGETPIQLQVEPNGAEFAHRAQRMTVDESAENPDPQDRITRDQGFVQLHVNSVPSKPTPGDVVAVHIGFNVSSTAKWNHETSPLALWIEDSGEINVSSQLITDTARYSVAESRTPLSLSFEVQIPQKQQTDIQLTAFALFNICESDGGQCLYRRRDFVINLPVSTD